MSVQWYPLHRTFQSTHPRGGATRPPRASQTSSCLFQSTHPRGGATSYPHCNQLTAKSFNPRTRGGVRRRRRYTALPDTWVSIHAPAGGCDTLDYYALVDGNGFQSTHPRGGATGLWVAQHFHHLTFQSTHPRGGATYYSTLINTDDNGFNPRTRGGVRRSEDCLQSGESCFNPRTRGGGATERNVFSLPPDISFNPRTRGGGATYRSRNGFTTCYCFNPRTRGGVRLPRFPALSISNEFQSTHPRGGATGRLDCNMYVTLGFNPRTRGGVRLQ